MPNLTIKGRDGRELQIADGGFIYFKDKEGEVNWEWQYISKIHPQIEKLLARAESMLDEVKELLPDLPMGSLK
jgi:phage pi2 protein 07